MRIRMINGQGGGRMKIDGYAGDSADALIINELELLEDARCTLKSACDVAGKTCTLGKSVPLTIDDQKGWGKRTAMIHNSRLTTIDTVDCHRHALRDVWN